MGTEPDDLDTMGPIDYLILEFPAQRVTGEGFNLLLDLVDRQIIRILDLLFVQKGLDGSVTGVALADVDGDGELDLTVFQGISSGLLGDDDLAEAGAALEPGRVAAVLIYENTWAAPLACALRRKGAQLVAGGRIPVQALLASLEATESIEATRSVQR